MHQLFPDKGIVLILGMSSDKNKYAIAENFSGHVKRVVFTKSLHGRADALAESGLAAVFQKKGVEVFRTSSVAEAIADALVKMSHDEILLVAGSLFLVAEARKIFLDKKKGDRNAI
jgi:dihydrofolate synthase/folylpolyglutamate synthase